MGLFNWIVNGVNAAVGRNQEFEQLLKANDVSRALSQMTDNSAKVEAALKVYDTQQHEVMNRPSKAVFGKKDPVTGNVSFSVMMRNGRFLFHIRFLSMKWLLYSCMAVL